MPTTEAAPLTPLHVPVYRQTAEFSCGAAALVMALHALRGTPVTRRFELRVWRDATMIGIPGIDAWGLAVPAVRRGVPATVITERAPTFPGTERAAEVFSEAQIAAALLGQQDNHERALDAGAVWVQRAPALEDVTGALRDGRVPIVLVDLLRLNGRDEAPHWLLAVATDGDAVVLHDPDGDGPGVRRLRQRDLWDAMDVAAYGAPRTVVALGP